MQAIELLGVPGSTLSFHLRELQAAGMVQAERAGRHLIYRPQLLAMNDLISYLSDHCCQGEPCELEANRSCC